PPPAPAWRLQRSHCDRTNGKCYWTGRNSFRERVIAFCGTGYAPRTDCSLLEKRSPLRLHSCDAILRSARWHWRTLFAKKPQSWLRREPTWEQSTTCGSPLVMNQQKLRARCPASPARLLLFLNIVRR